MSAFNPVASALVGRALHNWAAFARVTADWISHNS
jgi:hypothetical protein